jgi:hypothetical protein
MVVTRTLVSLQVLFWSLANQPPIRLLPRARTNRVAPLLILIPIAVVLALGLLTAWFVYCRRHGMYPALDMPSFRSGGTWKVYCAR